MKGSGVAALAASIAVFAVAAPTAGAADFSVTGTADGTGACTSSGSCTTLRSAIAAANTAGGTNTITLPAGTFTLTNGQLLVTKGSLTVTGAGVGKTIVDGNNASRIFEFTGSSNLTVSNLTLQHGNETDGGGGAIWDAGEGTRLAVTNSTLDHNSATGNGGSIYAPYAANVTVTDSTISNSTAGGNGGGIDASNLVMSGSTVNGNSATNGSGGGIYLTTFVFFCPIECAGVHADKTTDPNPSIVNSTIVGNSTGDGDGNTGGGIMVAPPFFQEAAAVQTKAAHAAAQSQPPNLTGLVSLAGDTIVGNSSVNGEGGNIASSSWGPFIAPLWIQGTIIGAGSAGGNMSNCSFDSFVTDAGSNLVFRSSSPTGDNSTPGDPCFPAPAVNDILNGDPRLAHGAGLDTDASGNFLLADNGGPTQTIALLPGSLAAINNVTDLPFVVPVAPVHAAIANPTPDCISDLTGLLLTTDQRGAARPDVAGTGCDIGAFESGAAPLVLTGSVTPNPGGIGKPINYSFTATNNGPSFGTQSTFDVTLPPGATFDSATPSQGSCTETNATTVHCTVGVIPDGTASVAIAVTPNAAGTYGVTATASDRESGTSAPLTLSANVNGTTTTTASILLPKPSTQVHACVSRRDFPIHVQNLRPLHIASATVYLNGLAVRTVRGKHLSAAIDLRQLPKGTFTVTIVARQTSGHVLRGKRTYHTCSVKLAGHKHLYL